MTVAYRISLVIGVSLLSEDQWWSILDDERLTMLCASDVSWLVVSRRRMRRGGRRMR